MQCRSFKIFDKNMYKNSKYSYKDIFSNIPNGTAYFFKDHSIDRYFWKTTLQPSLLLYTYVFYRLGRL